MIRLLLPRAGITMAVIVATIGVLSFLAGVALAQRHWVHGGWLVASAVLIALMLRKFVHEVIEEAFELGAGYRANSSSRLRQLPEAHQIPASQRTRWLDPKVDNL